MFKLGRVIWSPSTIARLHFSVQNSSRQKSNGNYFGGGDSLRTDGAGKTLTPRKQRRNVKQIHEDLKEQGYSGSYDRVAAFTR